MPLYAKTWWFVKLENLISLHIRDSDGLQVVKGPDDLEFLNSLQVHGYGSSERLIDVTRTRLPNHSLACISVAGKTFGASSSPTSTIRWYAAVQTMDSRRLYPFDVIKSFVQAPRQLSRFLMSRGRIGMSFECFNVIIKFKECVDARCSHW